MKPSIKSGAPLDRGSDRASSTIAAGTKKQTNGEAQSICTDPIRNSQDAGYSSSPDGTGNVAIFDAGGQKHWADTPTDEQQPMPR